LAKNSIVVTTYGVLASDNAFHREKSNDSNSYCPPLEQVRWWRIIVDEGHLLRHDNYTNMSLSNLVADHKWLVTGTPVNTSILDLKNQLKFLGIEYVDRIFWLCCEKEKHIDVEYPDKLLFFLRSLVMRHTQRQCYRGTNTSLMSLPAKTEISIEIDLPEAESREYDLLDIEAKEFYVEFKARNRQTLFSLYLKFSQKLTHMRVACSGGCVPWGNANPEEDDEDRSVVQKKEIKYSDFHFTAKFNALIQMLERAKDEDPTSKSLVFSQHSSTLNLLKEELPKHGFQFRTLSGKMSLKQRAKALHDFQVDPPTTIFLLSMM
jgi:SNF2 family DNA or RNA helicase